MIDPDDPEACACVQVQQDENCPVGYPSLLCDRCDGIGLLPRSEGEGVYVLIAITLGFGAAFALLASIGS